MATRKAYRAAPMSRPAVPVTWHRGVHITGTPVWCDAQRARDVCFVSSADASEAARHGQLIATQPTLRLLARRDRDQRPVSTLAAPYGRPFTLGTVRLELFRSGVAAGSASLLVERSGDRVVYAGAVNPQGGGLGGVADLRSCDTLIIDTTYAHPRFQFPELAEVQAATVAFAEQALAAGCCPVLLVTTPSKGVDVAAALRHLPLRAHRAIHRAGQRLRPEGFDVPPLRRWTGALRTDEVLLWPAQRRDDPALAGGRTALVSGLACAPDCAEAQDLDAAIPWSSRADYAGLIRYIASTGASRVYTTGHYAEWMETQFDAIPLGPQRQLSLF